MTDYEVVLLTKVLDGGLYLWPLFSLYVPESDKGYIVIERLNEDFIGAMENLLEHELLHIVIKKLIGPRPFWKEERVIHKLMERQR